MNGPATVPYGAWPSPITLDEVVAAGASLDHEVQVAVGPHGDETFWAERRPAEGGRVQVIRRRADGTTADLLPEGFSARTRVHEYGGGAWRVADGWLLFNNFEDHRLYRAPLDADGPGLAGDPEPITPASAVHHGLRYADLAVVGDFVIAVRELHHSAHTPPSEVVNEIVVLPLDGQGTEVVLVTGCDFVSSPRVSPDGAMLAWIEWDHPAMPWDATRACTGPLAVTHDNVSLGQVREIAGGPTESAIMPVWSPDGRLHLVSDRSGWWNIDASEPQTSAQMPRTELEADIGTPLWTFGMSRYAFLADGRIVFAAASGGLDRLGVVETDGTVTDLDLPYTEIESVTARSESAVFIGAGFDRESAVVEVPLPSPAAGVTVAGEPTVLRPSRDLGLDAAWFSIGRPISFPTGPDGERTAHALYYPPANAEAVAPDGELPPLIVLIHGGPTGMARARFDLSRQFWTSRGFALVDVNYGGSTGFGRAYRQLLDGQWGVVDVEDCIAAATHLADAGLADPERLCIRGGSAGGFTVLATLVASDAFAAGSSSYGIADLSVLAEETHKFESRYCDTMIGRYPEEKDVFDARSPIHHVDELSDPLIVFQGLDDEVVPPNQAEMIVDALRSKGVPVAYFPFEGEGHGWRRSETIVTALGAELAFYGRVLGFEPADELPDVDIANLPG